MSFDLKVRHLVRKFVDEWELFDSTSDEESQYWIKNLSYI